ncbi:MAG: cyclic nucleotide-binding domain-containing protein [Myxococcota bacterium]
MNPGAPWPDAVWQAPALRDLDAAGRTALVAGGRQRTFVANVELYAEGAASDSFFVVVDGAVAISTVRRGETEPSEIRRVGAGDTFGEEPLLHAGATRRATATGLGHGHLVELPATLYTRVAGKVGGGVADAVVRRLRRNATADLLRTMAATKALPDRELELMLDAIEVVLVPRGRRLYAPGDDSDAYYLVDTGLVQLQSEDPETGEIGVCGYVGPGDGFGHEGALSGDRRGLGAVSMGHTRVAKVPAAVLRTVVDRNRDVAARLSRVQSDRNERQVAAVAAADAGSTRHVFHDLYRMQVARSMLVIDGDSCVRCGHCAWTCAELHGTARLVRRGDKIITRVAAAASGAVSATLAQAVPKSLMVVNSCQHCKNPVCMLDCPTGAIGRDPEGEVFIQDSLCTGCTACAKACPWENIRMAPRPGVAVGSGATGPGTSEQLATKCDLCRGYDEPGCVQACPTDAITRLDPSRDVADVAGVLGLQGRRTAGRGSGAAWASVAVRALTVVVGIALSGWALALRNAGTWVPQSGMGWALGWVGLGGMLASGSYAGIKRLPKLWMARRKASRGSGHVARDQRPPPRSKVRGWLDLHALLGTLTIVAVCGHAGLAVGPGPYGSLLLASWAVFGLGILGAIAYRVIPRRLARLERRGTLPEDLGSERARLLDALYRRVSCTSPRVKAVAGELVVPYARAPLGSLLLLLIGRTEVAERQALLRRIATRYPPKTLGDENDALALEELVRIVVEYRTVPARRALTWVLRAWMPVHVALTGIVFALLAVHLVIVLGLPG